LCRLTAKTSKFIKPSSFANYRSTMCYAMLLFGYLFHVDSIISPDSPSASLNFRPLNGHFTCSELNISVNYSPVNAITCGPWNAAAMSALRNANYIIGDERDEKLWSHGRAPNVKDLLTIQAKLYKALVDSLGGTNAGDVNAALEKEPFASCSKTFYETPSVPEFQRHWLTDECPKSGIHPLDAAIANLAYNVYMVTGCRPQEANWINYHNTFQVAIRIGGDWQRVSVLWFLSGVGRNYMHALTSGNFYLIFRQPHCKNKLTTNGPGYTEVILSPLPLSVSLAMVYSLFNVFRIHILLFG
jgi:hypothetical protein